MKVSSDLHKLVHSMTRNEKGYFKKQHAGFTAKGVSNYIRLFDVIEKQKEYDEEKIKEKFAGENFVKQLHVTKNYLYSLILDSLSAYHRSVDMDLFQMLSHIDVLFKRGLYDQCAKVISRAMKLAQKFERFPILILLYNWERRMLKYADNYKGLERYLNEEYDKIQNYLDIVKETHEYEKLQVGIFYLQGKERYVRGEEEGKKFDAIINHPLMSDEKRARNFESLRSYLLTHAFYNLSMGELERSYEFRKKLVEEWDKRPHFLEENPWAYSRMVLNYAIINIELGRYNEALELIDKAEAIKTNNQLLKKDLELTGIAFRLEVLYKWGKYEEGFAMLAGAKEKAFAYEVLPTNKRVIGLYTFASFICLRAKQPSEAIWWLNNILNHTPLDMFYQEISFARILHLMVHYELGNEFLLESAVKTTYRFLYKRNKLYRFEELVLGFLRKSFRIADSDDLKKAAKELVLKLKELRKDNKEKRIVELFKLEEWLERNFLHIPN